MAKVILPEMEFGEWLQPLMSKALSVNMKDLAGVNSSGFGSSPSSLIKKTESNYVHGSVTELLPDTHVQENWNY